MSIHLSIFPSLSFTQKHLHFPSCQATMSDGQPASKACRHHHLISPSLHSILASTISTLRFSQSLYAVSFSMLSSVVRVDVLCTIHVYTQPYRLPLFTSLVPGLISPAFRRLLHHKKDTIFRSVHASRSHILSLPHLCTSISASSSTTGIVSSSP